MIRGEGKAIVRGLGMASFGKAILRIGGELDSKGCIVSPVMQRSLM